MVLATKIGEKVGLALPGLLVAGALLWVAGLPMQDFPEHVHMASVVANQWLDSGADAAAYSVSLSPGTYVGVHWVWLLLSMAAVPVGFGGRLIVIAYVLASLQAWGAVYHRMFIFPYALLVLAWAVHADWRRWTVVLVTCSAASHLGAVVIAHTAFHREVKPALQLLEQIPETHVVLPLFSDRVLKRLDNRLPFLDQMGRLAAWSERPTPEIRGEPGRPPRE